MKCAFYNAGVGLQALVIRLCTDWDVLAYVESDPWCRRVLRARMNEGRLKKAPIVDSFGGACDVAVAVGDAELPAAPHVIVVNGRVPDLRGYVQYRASVGGCDVCVLSRRHAPPLLFTPDTRLLKLYKHKTRTAAPVPAELQHALKQIALAQRAERVAGSGDPTSVVNVSDGSVFPFRERLSCLIDRSNRPWTIMSAPKRAADIMEAARFRSLDLDKVRLEAILRPEIRRGIPPDWTNT